MVFEVYGFSPSSLLSEFRGLPIGMVKRMMRELLEGVAFLHDKAGILHMDIKPENCVITLEEGGIDLAEVELEKKHYERKRQEKSLEDAKKKLEKGAKLNKNQRKRLKEKIKKQSKKLEEAPELEALPTKYSKRLAFLEDYVTRFLDEETR